MKNRIKYFYLKEILIIALGYIFNKILIYLQYQQKYLPVKREIENLLRNNFKFTREGNNILVRNLQNYGDREFLLRIGTSDQSVLKQVIIDEEYLPIIKLISEKNDLESIKLIIDAGSNIGLTSIFFYGFFPNASIISIEPDKYNYLHQLKNIEINELNDKITVLNKALWINNTDHLNLNNDFRDGKEWSMRVKFSKKDSDTIQLITIRDIMDKLSKNQVIDILKIDIEGTEQQLFESSDFVEILAESVRFLCLEIHDELNIRESIRNVLHKNEFEFFDIGETTFGYNKTLEKKLTTLMLNL